MSPASAMFDVAVADVGDESMRLRFSGRAAAWSGVGGELAESMGAASGRLRTSVDGTGACSDSIAAGSGGCGADVVGVCLRGTCELCRRTRRFHCPALRRRARGANCQTQLHGVGVQGGSRSGSCLVGGIGSVRELVESCWVGEVEGGNGTNLFLLDEGSAAATWNIRCLSEQMGHTPYEIVGAAGNSVPHEYSCSANAMALPSPQSWILRWYQKDGTEWDLAAADGCQEESEGTGGKA